jgi:hypothetical protein
MLTLCSLYCAHALADCSLEGSAIVAGATEVAGKINSLNQLAARDLEQVYGPVCANSFSEKPDVAAPFSELSKCSGPDAGSKKFNGRDAPSLALAKMLLSAAINKDLCLEALDFRLEFLRRLSASGASNTGDDQRVAGIESLSRTTMESAEQLSHGVQRLLPVSPGDNDPDALAILGALYMQPMPPTKDEGLAADYLYRAAAAYLDANQRDKAIRMLSGLDSFEAGKPLAERLRARLNGDGNHQ